METRILLVEDDQTLRESLRYRLQTDGYIVTAVGDGETAVTMACTLLPHLILLDLMLPGIDGYTVCKRLRECCASMQVVPIVMITARTEEIDKVTALELGVDDYITKPFGWMELRARIRSHLRRSLQYQQHVDEDLQGTIDIAGLHIDLDQREVLQGTKPIQLTARLFDLLVYFARHPNIVLTRRRLLERVWGYDFEGDTNTVNVHIHWLREKIETLPNDPQLIHTVRGVGYRFIA